MPSEKEYQAQMKEQDAFIIKCEYFINREWTKRDTFIYSNADSEQYYNAHQIWSSLMGFGKERKTEVLLNEYMAVCKIPGASTELPSEQAKELDGFREHRWEQSIMSILVERYKLHGISDTQVVNWVTKYYSQELLKMKEIIKAQ